MTVVSNSKVSTTLRPQEKIPEHLLPSFERRQEYIRMTGNVQQLIALQNPNQAHLQRALKAK